MARSSPYFSVIIPTYNRPSMLEEAVNSVLAQSFMDYEIIIVNDGSDKNYYDILKNFNDKSITYIEMKSSSGVSNARNTGAKIAKGKWLIFLDDDDTYTPRCLQERYLNIEKYSQEDKDIGFAWCNVKHKIINKISGREVDNHYSNFKYEYEDQTMLYSDAFKVGAGYGLSIKTSVFEKIGGFNINYPVGEDTDMILRLITQGYQPIINMGIGVIISHHENEKLSQNMANRSTLGIIDLILKDHIELFNKYIPLKMTFLCWATKSHYQAGNFELGDNLFKLVMEIGLKRRDYLVWCKDVVLHKNFYFKQHLENNIAQI